MKLHSTGRNMDHYIENVGLELSLPGCLAINVYSNVHTQVHAPNVFCLGLSVKYSVNQILTIMFPIKFRYLKPDGRIYPCRNIMGATFFMSYDYFSTPYKSSDLFLTKLTNCAKSSNIDMVTLVEWSKTIEKDFQLGNHLKFHGINLHVMILILNGKHLRLLKLTNE